MSDDLSKRGGSDRARININQEHEVRHWAEKFGVSAEELRNAIHAVGDHAERVREHLKAHQRRASPSGEDVR